MEVVVASDVAAEFAARLSAAIAQTVAAHGRCTVGLSGGRTPWEALRRLAAAGLPWESVDWVQVDEREAPEGTPERNLTGLLAALPPEARLHPMPVERADADADYAKTLAVLRPLDVVHLGLGDDGHTASLVPGDDALGAAKPVAWTGLYQGRRRLTLTYPTLDRAGLVLWLVAGASKRPMVRRLLDGDATIPAGRVRAAVQVLVCDPAAAP